MWKFSKAKCVRSVFFCNYSDVVFFGQSLPARFYELQGEDFRQCDLLIIAGTTLSVFPFAGLVNDVSLTTPRLLFNKESVGIFRQYNLVQESSVADPLAVNYRDVQCIGDCDAGIVQLCEMLGWHSELQALLNYSPAQPIFSKNKISCS